MRALVLGSNGNLTLDDVPIPSRHGECRIRVTLAGICGTDLQMLDGYADFSGIPGHEFVGVVEDAPAADAQWIGKRVVGEINVGCGECEWCMQGVKEHCTRRTVVGIRQRHGAFAEFLSLPASNLHEIAAAVDDPTAVFVEPVAAACRILEQLDINASTRSAVIGDGRLGIIVAQVLRTRTPNLTLYGRHAHKLNAARALGIDARSAPDLATYDVVVDATGRRDGLARATALVRPRGTIVLKSTFHGDSSATPLWPIPVHEITVVGSRCGPFTSAIELLVSGAVRVAPLIHSTFALDDYDRAFATARRELKVLLDPQRSSTTARRM